MNPFGYHVHAGEILKCDATDKNQATPAWYHISDQNINLEILGLYGSLIGLRIRTCSEHALYCSIL
jgi:hypothetical protein